MAKNSSPPASFSAPRRLNILLSVVVSTLAVVALVIMANYVAARHPVRYSLSSQTQTKVSPKTAGLLRSLTNQVKVVVYYDRTHEPLYSSICSLLDEYRLINPGIAVEKVDYVRNPAAAQRIKATYKFSQSEEKDLVIFDCEGHSSQIVPGNMLGDFSLSAVASKDEKREWVRHLKDFKGDQVFATMILGVTNHKVQTAAFLEDHGEHRSDGTGPEGYHEFKSVLSLNWIHSGVVSLLGTNTITPKDCNLLIIAGPQAPLHDIELDKIRKYLNLGGRLLVLFNPQKRTVNTGLESLLTEWGVRSTNSLIVDKEHSPGPEGYDLVVQDFSKHPAVSQLQGLGLYLLVPRPVGKINATNQGPDAPKVEELAFSSDHALMNNNPAASGKAIPLMVAVEKGSVKGDLNEHGATRIIAVGESLFLDNANLDEAGNREFANSSVNWLLDQTQLLQGIGPQMMTEYKLMMTRGQLTSIRWLFLAGMPGSLLLLGGIVWLRRRH